MREIRYWITIYKKPVILVMSGMGLVNAAVATQLLLSLFEIEGVIHYGIAGNANLFYIGGGQLLNIGLICYVELAGEVDVKEIGVLKIATYSSNGDDNLLNNVWYQAEEVYPVDGTPEQTQQAFWIPVDSNYFSLSKRLEVLFLYLFTSLTTLVK
ncbi:nucleoside phosphorylase [Tanacetum coccineum]